MTDRLQIFWNVTFCLIHDFFISYDYFLHSGSNCVSLFLQVCLSVFWFFCSLVCLFACWPVYLCRFVFLSLIYGEFDCIYLCLPAYSRLTVCCKGRRIYQRCWSADPGPQRPSRGAPCTNPRLTIFTLQGPGQSPLQFLPFTQKFSCAPYRKTFPNFWLRLPLWIFF